MSINDYQRLMESTVSSINVQVSELSVIVARLEEQTKQNKEESENRKRPCSTLIAHLDKHKETDSNKAAVLIRVISWLITSIVGAMAVLAWKGLK